MQVLVAGEVRADDDEVQELALLGLEVADRLAVAVDDPEAPRGRAARRRRPAGCGSSRSAGELGRQPVRAGDGLDHRLALHGLVGHLLVAAGLGAAIFRQSWNGGVASVALPATAAAPPATPSAAANAASREEVVVSMASGSRRAPTGHRAAHVDRTRIRRFRIDTGASP